MNNIPAHKNIIYSTHTLALSIQLVILLFFLCPGVPFVQADNRTVTVGVYENAPKVFTSEDGRPSGIFIDIIEFIAKKEGWNLKYVPGTWAEGLDRLAKGEIDLMPDVAYTAEREKKFSFHKVQVLSSWFQVFTREGSGIQSISDLNGKRIAILEESVQQEAFIRLADGFRLNITLIPVPDYKTAFEIVAGKKSDAAITNQFYGAMHARKYGLEDTAVVFEPSALFFAAAKGANEQLLHTIDKYMRDMKKDSQSIYYGSMKRWTSEEVRFKFPVWLQFFGLAAGIVLLMSIGGSIFLKRQVNARTHELRRINQAMEQHIAERELAEEALRRSEEKYRSIFENSIMGIFRTTADGRYLSANPAGARMYGYKSQEEMMQSVTDMSHQIYVHPEDRKRFKELLESNGYIEGFEAEHYTGDGSKIWASMNARVICDASGAILYYETTSQNITKRKRAEEELDKYRLNLEELVQARTQELEKAKEAAEGADRLKSAFLATMSHELRTPLNSIIGFTGILLQGLVGQLNDEQKKQLNMVRTSANHLLSLISDVLDISKIEAGQFQVEYEQFDLPASIRKVEQTVRPLAGGKGLDLTIDVSSDIGLIRSDMRRVEQVLLNLLSNAIKFTVKGRVTVACSANHGAVIVRVTDTGIGIRNEDIDKVFKPFMQIDSGLTRKYEGTGLGLSICRKLIQLLGGEIWVESEYGQGSVFTFTLPINRGVS
jgi:PAS domain S-box-containing protein